MLTWLKDNGPVIGALAGTLVAVVAVLQIVVVGPMNSRFDDLRADVTSRFDDLRADVNGRFDDFRSEVNGRFDAAEQRFSDFRAEVNQRFDAVDQRFNDFRAEVNQRFDAVDQRFDAVDQRLDRLDNDVSGLRALSDRVSRSEGQIDFLMQQLQTVDAPTP